MEPGYGTRKRTEILDSGIITRGVGTRHRGSKTLNGNGIFPFVVVGVSEMVAAILFIFGHIHLDVFPRRDLG